MPSQGAHKARRKRVANTKLAPFLLLATSQRRAVPDAGREAEGGEDGLSHAEQQHAEQAAGTAGGGGRTQRRVQRVEEEGRRRLGRVHEGRRREGRPAHDRLEGVRDAKRVADPPEARARPVLRGAGVQRRAVSAQPRQAKRRRRARGSLSSAHTGWAPHVPPRQEAM